MHKLCEDKIESEYVEWLEDNCLCDQEDCECMTMEQWLEDQINSMYALHDDRDEEEMYA